MGNSENGQSEWDSNEEAEGNRDPGVLPGKPENGVGSAECVTSGSAPVWWDMNSIDQSPLFVALNGLVKALSDELEKEKHSLEALKANVDLDV